MTDPTPVTSKVDPDIVAIELPETENVTGRLLVPEADSGMTVPIGLYVMVDGDKVKAMVCEALFTVRVCVTGVAAPYVVSPACVAVIVTVPG